MILFFPKSLSPSRSRPLSLSLPLPLSLSAGLGRARSAGEAARRGGAAGWAAAACCCGSSGSSLLPLQFWAARRRGGKAATRQATTGSASAHAVDDRPRRWGRIAWSNFISNSSSVCFLNKFRDSMKLLISVLPHEYNWLLLWNFNIRIIEAYYEWEFISSFCLNWYSPQIAWIN